MKIDNLVYDDNHWSINQQRIDDASQCCAVFVFGDSDIMRSESAFLGLRQLYPSARIVGASSSGNILGAEISSSQIVATAVQFELSSVSMSVVDFSSRTDIEAIASQLIKQLPSEGLRHIFILSDGLSLNGSELVKGINKVSHGVTVTGGMAGDGDRFQSTWVIADAPARQNCIVAIGFYGDRLTISSGSNGGWRPMGVDRLVTRSIGNVLYELDNMPALDLYKSYLGEFADSLPHSGMRFPLLVHAPGDSNAVIRTLLGVDSSAKSITFAGDISEGYIAKLTSPDIRELIDGAGDAAREIELANESAALGLVVSCVGRRAVMKHLIDDELEIVQDILGSNVQLTGFYSYGEIAPFNDRPEQCQLHNQTMTLTAIYEG